MSNDLLTVPGFAPAALVVEFNLYALKHPGACVDPLRHETEAQYHQRLANACAILQPDGEPLRVLGERARQWSDHYAKRGTR